MEQLKYSKEGARNYLILPCPSGKEDDFQVKMMERGNIRECLPCKLRHINGSSYFYYDITSKVSLKNYRNARKWTRDQIVRLLTDIDSAQEELRRYLLIEDYLVLDPELIFYDFDTKTFLFLFYPVDRGLNGELNYLERLLEYLLDNMDHQDEAVSNMMYEVFEEAESGALTIARLKKKLESTGEEKEPAAEELQTTKLEQDALPQSYLSAEDEWNFSKMEREAEMQSTMQTAETKNGKRTLLYYVILIFAAVLVEAGIGAVYFLFQCNRTEQVILFTVSVVVGILLIVFLYLFFRERAFQKRKEIYNSSLIDYREQDYIDQTQPKLDQVKMDDFLYRNPRSEQSMPTEGDETVFFSPELTQEKKLYALDRKNKVHISLDTLPCTIGKAGDMVDYCIKDNSVSRMHAKIEERGGHFILTDMNSTNGTFVNGLQMSPNEQIEIERGDEIRFGKMRYSFR